MDGGAKRPGSVGEGKERGGEEGKRKWIRRKRSLEANQTRGAIRSMRICPRMKPFRAGGNQSRVCGLYEVGERDGDGRWTEGGRGWRGKMASLR